VDFEKRMQFLFQLVLREEKGKPALLKYLAEHRAEGVEKLYIIWKVLNFRKKYPLLFTEGEYIPLAVTGEKNAAAGYVRQHGSDWVMVVFPFGLVTHELAAAGDDGTDQFVVLPDSAPHSWSHLFTGETIEAANQISVAYLFSGFPIALLVAEHAK
jgi:(1->4)-alpha-D-glucan 1-alpha-D-glucosylmutase